MNDHILRRHKMQGKFQIILGFRVGTVLKCEFLAVLGGDGRQGCFQRVKFLLILDPLSDLFKGQGLDVFLEGLVGVKVKAEVDAGGDVHAHAAHPCAVGNGHPRRRGGGDADKSQQRKQHRGGKKLPGGGIILLHAPPS